MSLTQINSGILVFLYGLVPYSGMNSPLALPFKFLLAFFILINVVSVVIQMSHAILFFYSFLIFLLIWFQYGLEVEPMLDYASYLLFILLLFLNNPGQSPRWKKVIMLVTLINFFVVIVDSWYQWLNGTDFLFGNELLGGRVTGPFSWGAPVVGSFLVASFGLTWSWSSKISYRIFLLSIFLPTMLLTGNRAFYLIFLSLVFVINYSYQKLLVAAILVLVLSFNFSSLIEALPLNDSLIYRLTSLEFSTLFEEQSGKRLATYIQTLNVIRDFAFFGVGPGNFEYMHGFYLGDFQGEGVMPHPHQVYLDLLVNFGIFGAVIIVYRFARLLKYASFIARWGILVFLSPFNVTHSIKDNWWTILLLVPIVFYTERRSELFINR